MKTIYLVRHGESESNATDRYNSVDSALSEKGREQAAAIADRCAKLPIEAIVASPIVRAKHTGDVISGRINVPVEVSDLFAERKLPTSLQGQKKHEPKILAAMTSIQENFCVPEFRYEDGENFDDLKQRALASLTYLEGKSEQHVLVVTHGFFLSIIAAAVIFGDKLTSKECMRMMRGLQVMRNTGLSILRYDDHTGQGLDGLEAPWQLRVWNDHAHLG